MDLIYIQHLAVYIKKNYIKIIYLPITKDTFGPH